MKPRNRFEKAVAASNMKLSTVSPKAIEWALGNIIVHIAFRTSGHNSTCGDCGAKFDHKGKRQVGMLSPLRTPLAGKGHVEAQGGTVRLLFFP